jgi:hypothetical protein
MNFVANAQHPAPRRAKVASGRLSPLHAAGDNYYQIALELLKITDQFEIMRTALIHAVDMCERGQSEPLDLAFALLRASGRKIQEVSVRSQLMLRDDDLDSATMAYGG